MTTGPEGAKLYAAERQESILASARAQGRVDVGTLAESLGVTVETVRRDLTALERRGLVRRVHGGALPIERLTLEPTLEVRHSQHLDRKGRIAQRALAEVPEGGTVLLDAGSTTFELARFLPRESPLTVITNSIEIAGSLADSENLEVLVLGGRVRHRTGASVGGWAAGALRDVFVDVAFLGTNGFDVTRGFTTPDQAESTVKRAMASAARRVIVCADSSKAGQVHLHRFCPTGEVAMLITDDGLDEETAGEFESVGVEVVCA